MDPFHQQTQQYSDLKVISPDQLQTIKKQTKVVLFGNLVVSIQAFNHPGYNSTLSPYQNTDTYKPYIQKNHSINADLIVCQRTIGRIINQSLEQQSSQFYNSTINNQKVQRHQQLVKKFQPNQPLMQTLKTLNSQQFFLLTQIPKVFKNPEQVKFLKGSFQNFMYEEHFYISTPIFVSYLLLLIYWIWSAYQVKQIINSLIFLPIGIVTWTVFQYTYHRYLFHPSDRKLQLKGHPLHHAFPNLKNKISLGIISNTKSFVIAFLIISVIISPLAAAMFLVGLLPALIAYDSIHYYCHFGPQIQIGWLKTLKINHLKHHYRNQSSNFGVTNNFWDKVMGTYEQNSKNL